MGTIRRHPKMKLFIFACVIAAAFAEPDLERLVPESSVNSIFMEVTDGVTMSKVAESAGISLAALQELNPKLDADNLQIGSHIKLVQGTEAANRLQSAAPECASFPLTQICGGGYLPNMQCNSKFPFPCMSCAIKNDKEGNPFACSCPSGTECSPGIGGACGCW